MVLETLEFARKKSGKESLGRKVELEIIEKELEDLEAVEKQWPIHKTNSKPSKTP